MVQLERRVLKNSAYNSSRVIVSGAGGLIFTVVLAQLCWRLRWAGFRLLLEDDYSEMAWHIRLRVDFAWLCSNDDRSSTLFSGLAWRDTEVHFIRGKEIRAG